MDYMRENWSDEDGQTNTFVVVHGAAAGADQHSVDAQRRLKGTGWPITQERHPADWQKQQRRAGFIRNSHMVSLGADVCLAFVHNDSRGAIMCAKLAREAVIPTIYYRIDDK